MSVRGKESANGWLMVAQIPVPKFEEKLSQGILVNRLYHSCMDIVTSALKAGSGCAIDMVDAGGFLRRVRTLLFAFIADQPEMLTIACVAGNRSPLSTAEQPQFGSSVMHPVRRGGRTLRQIEKLLKHHDPNDLDSFSRVSKAVGLNGVHAPFWRDWMFADPSIFFAPDALHQWHRFFMDHPVKWARKLLGDDELDRRISVLQKRVGFRHFRNGFTRFRQHTGREQRDIERVFVAILQGHRRVTPGIMMAFRSIMDFIYIAQRDCQSTETLRSLRSALKKFHRNKISLSNAGVRDGKRTKGLFNIPKLELMHHVARIIQQLGAASQYTSDQTERLHISNAKIPYEKTNKKDYVPQMCRFLDRDARVSLFSLYVMWMGATNESGNYEMEACFAFQEGNGGRLMSESSDRLLGTIFGHDSDEQNDSRERRFQRVAETFLPRQVSNRFSGRIQNATTAFTLTPHGGMVGRTVGHVATRYGIPDLKHVLRRYLHISAQLDLRLDTWDYVRMQVRTAIDEPNASSAAPLTVLATPPNKTYPHGCFNFVLARIRDHRIPEIQGMYLFHAACARTSSILSDHPRSQCRSSSNDIQAKPAIHRRRRARGEDVK